jgi:hypothetical protein
MVVCNNLAHFDFLLTQIKNNPQKIIGDLENHTISTEVDDELKEVLLKKLQNTKKRTEKLRQIYSKNNSLPIEDIWPKLKIIGCWLSSSVGRAAFDMKRKLPKDINYIEWGYGASEGKFNVPFELNQSGGPIASFACFFLFLPLEGGNPLTIN